MTLERKQSRRYRLYKLLELSDDSGWLSKAIDYFLIALITVNVIAVIMETVESINARFMVEFYWLEIFSVTIFTLEYLLRIWCCVEDPAFARHKSFANKRVHFVITPMAIIDLLAILPFFLAFLFSIDLRFLRVLRLLRIFKLTRYSAAMTTLLKVLKEESSNFAAAIFIMIVIMVVAASGIYLVEHKIQPDNFGSIPQSMWWAIVTLTTVGYGDATPITLFGKFFAACIMIAGVGLVALPTGILASSFSENLNRNRATLRKELANALEDGVIDEDEQRALTALSKELGISDDVVKELQQSLIDLKNQEHQKTSLCPHCGKDF